jgi:hypothetical protein
MDLTERARIVLAAWGIRAVPSDFLDHRVGAPLLALLCNAGAKFLDRADLYAHKHALLLHAVAMHERHGGEWWINAHRGYVSPYPHPSGAGDYVADTVVYLELPSIGRMSFHVCGTDADLAALMRRAPQDARGWDGRALQPIALELALAFIGEL